jgi:organic hydroperoxide reductase OsmC/OhrA
MSEEGRFTIQLEQQDNYQINVRFDWKKAADILMDEPPPLGEASGPNAARLLAAAAANCLSASLLYCVTKEGPPANSLRTEASCIMIRNEANRLRIGGMEVRLIVNDELAGSKRFDRCKDLFEGFCIVSASIRDGVPIKVFVEDQKGRVLHSSE